MMMKSPSAYYFIDKITSFNKKFKKNSLEALHALLKSFFLNTKAF